jgi:tetratricopeptide (TPR) repeat protein
MKSHRATLPYPEGHFDWLSKLGKWSEGRDYPRRGGPAMPPSGVRRCRSLATWRTWVAAAVVLSAFQVSPLAAQQSRPDTPGAPASDVSNIPKSITDTLDRVSVRTPNPQARQQTVVKDETCLLAPLTLVASPTIAAGQLRIKAKARNEYEQACKDLKSNQAADGEKHLRKALQHDSKYAAGWVTLGQVLAAQQRPDEALNACLQGSVADASYVPAYLCLADMAARARQWDQVLKTSERALQLDPVNNALAYEYHAAANLNVHNLAAAEKSALRAAEIDKDHRDPRAYFILAQIYEAKGDSANEAAQLREYLKYARSPGDIAAVRQYLSKLEVQAGRAMPVGDPPGPMKATTPPRRRWGPAEIDEEIPPVLKTACPLAQILKETSEHTQYLIESLQRFGANESIEEIEVGSNGRSRRSTPEVANYVAQIEENSSGYPTIKEYRSGGGEHRQVSVLDTGTVTFALIFHPIHVKHFDFRCEGFTDLQASPAWQLRFEESTNSSQSFQAIQVGHSVYLPRLKGRAWIASDSYNVLQMETDLVAPISQIGLQREHFVIAYAPVEFRNRQVRLWLPESAFLYMVYRGHQYERIHKFSRFQLFSVDAAQAIKEPVASKNAPSQ